MSITSRIKEYFFSRKWRKLNQHNGTYPMGIFNPALVEVGRKTYGVIQVSMFNETARLKIGSFCSIGPHVEFLLSSDHASQHFSTFPFKVKYGLEEFEGISKGDIIVDDDVWIGYGATILSGVHIGQGAIIAAGSIVVKDIPPYAIVAGVPAKVVKYRFRQEIIDEFSKVDFSLIDDDKIITYMEELYRDISSPEDLADLSEKLMRKK